MVYLCFPDKLPFYTPIVSGTFAIITELERKIGNDELLSIIPEHSMFLQRSNKWIAVQFLPAGLKRSFRSSKDLAWGRQKNSGAEWCQSQSLQIFTLSIHNITDHRLTLLVYLRPKYSIYPWIGSCFLFPPCLLAWSNRGWQLSTR